MEKIVTDVHVFGRTLKLSCPKAEEEALQIAAKDLDNRLRILKEKASTLSSDQLIITVALNLSYELSKERSSTNKTDDEFNNRLKDIQELLNNALNPQNS